MFVGREKELKILENKISSSSFEFGVMYGRRRIGKTRILQEITKKHHAIYYVFNEMGLEHNLEQLSRVIAEYFDLPISFDSLEQLFEFLAHKSQKDKIILILDEFTYLMSTNKEILSILQNIVDHILLDSNLKLIISGSHVGMIEDAITYKKPLYGRATFKMKVESFDYFDAAKFYPKANFEDKIIYYSIFGGVPFYASRIDDRKTVKENIISLIVEDGAIFEDEVHYFLTQEVRSVVNYEKILNAIATGATRMNEISNKSGIRSSGTTSNYLEILQNLSIVEKIYSFGESNNSRKTIYTIKDQLFNFHYRFIERYQTQISIMDPSKFYDRYIEPHFNEYVSLEFKKICQEFLIRKYQNTIEEIGTYWFNDAKTKTDIEIDIVMKNDGKIYAFECKWTTLPIGKSVQEALKTKLIHFENVTLGYFSKSGYTETLCSDYKFVLEDLYSL